MRRPDLYADLVAPLDAVPAAAMYGPAGEVDPAPVPVATLQVSWFHNRDWTVTRALSQVRYAAARGARIGVLPELFCFRPGEVAADPAAAAAFSADVLDRLGKAAAEHGLWLAASLVEAGAAGTYHSTAYLAGDDGSVALAYRRAHLDERDRSWATPGDDLPVIDTPVGRIGMLVGSEIWVPEAARVLALRGAELILHPADWDRPQAAEVAATERTEENRVHLVSSTRLDSRAPVGSQVVRADEFAPDQPIALMRSPPPRSAGRGSRSSCWWSWTAARPTAR